MDLLSTTMNQPASLMQSKWEAFGLTSPYRARRIRIAVYVCQMVVDLLTILMTFIIMSPVVTGYYLRNEDTALAVVAIVIYFIVSFSVRNYSFSAIQSANIAIARVAHAWFLTLGIVLFIIFTTKQGDQFSRAVFLAAGLGAGVAMAAAHVVAVALVRAYLKAPFVCELLIQDGVTETVVGVFDRHDADELGLSPDPSDPISLHNFSCLVASYDRVVVSCPAERRGAWAMYLQAAGCNGELLMPELLHVALSSQIGRQRLPTVQVSVGPLDLPNRLLKRLFDLAVTLPLLIALIPLFLAVSIAIKLESRGPVFFLQQRMGRSNRLFYVIKFRSMRHEQADRMGNRSASPNDDRVTRVGRLIRATSVDELPQLFNVLLGQMALVGPRPHALGSRAGEDLFWHVDNRYWLRHLAKPGITGLAQVRGFRGATDHRDDLSNRLRSDLEYLTEWSIAKDLQILIRTLGVVVHKKAY